MEQKTLHTRGSAAIVGLVGVALIGWLDWMTGTELAFSAFYLLPIGYATWFGGRRIGLGASLVGAIAFPAMEILSERVYSSAWIPIWNASIRLITLSVVTLLLDGLLRQLAHVTALSQVDPLTGVLRGNRVMELLSHEIERARRYGHPFSAAYIDVDDFKKVNDTHGHAAGDEVLRRVGSAMRNSMRASDLCARMGGDEFFVVMPEADGTAARTIIERLQRELAAASSGGPRVTFSIGVVTFEQPPQDADTAVTRVDELMYDVKRSGKNSFRHQTAA